MKRVEIVSNVFSVNLDLFELYLPFIHIVVRFA